MSNRSGHWPGPSCLAHAAQRHRDPFVAGPLRPGSHEHPRAPTALEAPSRPSDQRTALSWRRCRRREGLQEAEDSSRDRREEVPRETQGASSPLPCSRLRDLGRESLKEAHAVHPRPELPTEPSAGLAPGLGLASAAGGSRRCGRGAGVGWERQGSAPRAQGSGEQTAGGAGRESRDVGESTRVAGRLDRGLGLRGEGSRRWTAGGTRGSPRRAPQGGLAKRGAGAQKEGAGSVGGSHRPVRAAGATEAAA